MNNTNEHKPQVTEGSGSAENIGKSREEQKNRNFDISDDQKRDIAEGIGVKQSDIADPEDLGAASGRDDLAGGFGDGMINQSTDEPTDVLAREDDNR